MSNVEYAGKSLHHADVLVPTKLLSGLSVVTVQKEIKVKETKDEQLNLAMEFLSKLIELDKLFYTSFPCSEPVKEIVVREEVFDRIAEAIHETRLFSDDQIREMRVNKQFRFMGVKVTPNKNLSWLEDKM